MDSEGIDQVKERLSRLRSAAAVVASSAPLQEQESAWLDFLSYHGTLYSKLEQAAKASAAAKKWFEGKKAERKSDELLRYLHHARNVGEHTIRKASGKAVFAVSGTLGKGDAMLGISFDQNGKPHGHGAGVGNMTVHQNEVLLLAAVDRGVTYPPPKAHRGKNIGGDTAREVVQLALAHADNMVDEAGVLGPPK